MDLPVNHFKRAIRAGRQQIGLWNSLPSSFVVEALAVTGYDWILIDTEHAPTEVAEVLPSLQALAPYNVTAAVRPAANDAVLIKRYLDLGVQTLLIPYVQNALEAEAAVKAMRYAPRGMRGVAGLTRASRFGKVDNYATRAEDELCLLVQVETGDGLAEIEAIAKVDGVDGIFIGPSDLAASLGHPGDPEHPDVVAAIEDGICRIIKTGKPAGILTLNPVFAKRCIELGTSFTAVGVDLALMNQAAETLAREFGKG